MGKWSHRMEKLINKNSFGKALLSTNIGRYYGQYGQNLK